MPRKDIFIKYSCLHDYSFNIIIVYTLQCEQIIFKIAINELMLILKSFYFYFLSVKSEWKF